MAMLSPLQVLGASMSSGTDNSPPAAVPNLQRPSTEDDGVWRARLGKRMENINPNQLQSLNPNVINQQPVPHPNLHPLLTPAVENQGVPGVNLPCGWLDGHEEPDGEAGVDSESFDLGPGRYILHLRWTRTPHLAGVATNLNLIDINDHVDYEPMDTIYFPGTRMPWTIIVNAPEGSDFFLDLRRSRTDNDPHGMLVNDAAVIWWFEREPGSTAGSATSINRAGRRPMGPVDEGVERPSQRPRRSP